MPIFWNYIYFFQYIGYNTDMNTYQELMETTDEDLKTAFGNSLKELREYVGITQVELAKVTNVPRQSVSVYERGETVPTITQAYRISKFFRLSIDDFIIYGLEKQKEILNENFASITDKYDSMQ